MAKKVLVIDDDKNFLKVIRSRLEANGYQTVCVDQGSEGFKKAREIKPDLILLDIIMPETDGFAVLEMLKNDGHTVSIPVVIISGKNEVEDIKKGMASGAVDYLIKPFSPVDFLRIVKRAIAIFGSKDS